MSALSAMSVFEGAQGAHPNPHERLGRKRSVASPRVTIFKFYFNSGKAAAHFHVLRVPVGGQP
jgi:hypothetical protein